MGIDEVLPYARIFTEMGEALTEMLVKEVKNPQVAACALNGAVLKGPVSARFTEELFRFSAISETPRL